MPLYEALAEAHAATPSFRGRIITALATIEVALKKSKKPYIAFSGGKDSLALTWLVHAVHDAIPLVWSDDELEYPETVEYMDRFRLIAGKQLITTLGHTTHAGWFRPWEDHPFWREPYEDAVLVLEDVDDWMDGQGYDLVFTGLRAEESRRRRDWLLQVAYGDPGEMPGLYRVASGTGRRCCPLWDWTVVDVWTLIQREHLPYNPAYDRMAEAGIELTKQRVGPLPLARRSELEAGWPGLLTRLEARYGKRWH